MRRVNAEKTAKQSRSGTGEPAWRGKMMKVTDKEGAQEEIHGAWRWDAGGVITAGTHLAAGIPAVCTPTLR